MSLFDQMMKDPEFKKLYEQAAIESETVYAKVASAEERIAVFVLNLYGIEEDLFDIGLEIMPPNPVLEDLRKALKNIKSARKKLEKSIENVL